ncbi:hypothetical protein D3C84_732650 [compost metagenome]
MALGRQGWPFFIPFDAICRAVQVAAGIRVDLDFATIALDHDGGVAEQPAGFTMHRLVAGVEDALQAATGAQRIEHAGQGVNGRAQAQGVAQVDHPLQARCPVLQWNKCQLLAIQGLGNGIPVTAQRDLQQLKHLLGVQASGGVGAAAVQQDAHAVGGQALGGKQVPGQVALLAGVARPVEVHRDLRCVQTLTQRFGEAGQFLRAFLLVP